MDTCSSEDFLAAPVWGGQHHVSVITCIRDVTRCLLLARALGRRVVPMHRPDTCHIPFSSCKVQDAKLFSDSGKTYWPLVQLDYTPASISYGCDTLYQLRLGSYRKSTPLHTFSSVMFFALQLVEEHRLGGPF